MKYKGGVYCVNCAPELKKSNEALGTGFRYRETPNGRVMKGKKGNLSCNKNHKMRTNMGMNYVFGK